MSAIDLLTCNFQVSPFPIVFACVTAKPLDLEEGPEYRTLDRLKLDNGCVPSTDFVAHRRSTGQRHHEPNKEYERLHQRREQPRKQTNELIESGVANAEGLHHKGKVVGRQGRRVTRRDDKNLANQCCFEDDMVDGWPKWLVDNVPTQVLAGLVPRSA
ncbi:hypothetical protein JHK85_057496 [Glycine max]|nr:hypothetical protein JHK85_057496 [Glycine max]